MSINRVKSIAMTVADMNRSIEFYTTVLAFTKIADRQTVGIEAVDESCLAAERVPPHATKIQLRVVELQLGNETLELTEFLTAKGRSIPSDSRSHDRWFQHIAIVVSDIDRAYQHLQQHRVTQTSPNPQTLPDWNPVAGGIQAFYFQDPDGHNLELIYFPPSKGDPRWQQSADALFLGIDHTAIVVADTVTSRAFYCDLLEMKLQQESENSGVEQERLSGVTPAKVRISSLAAPTGIGIELLEYLEPTDGRPMPLDTESNDLWYWETTVVVADSMDTIARLSNANFPLVCAEVAPSPTSALEFVRDFLILDPDGHAIRLVDR